MEQKEMVIAQLDARNISYQIDTHPAVYTIDDMEQLGLNTRGEIAKNLFLRNSNGKQHFLVVLCHDKKVNLKDLQKKLGSTALSFASENRLKKYLGLTKGAVTPLGIFNNYDCSVIVVMDKELKEKNAIGVHPNDNTATVWLTTADIIAIVTEHGNEIRFLDFE